MVVSVSPELEKKSCAACCMESSANVTYERDRLDTFSTTMWNEASVRMLAAQGFYFTYSPGLVQCAFCGLQLEFQENELIDITPRQLQQIHIEQSDCDIFKSDLSGNVPLNEGDSLYHGNATDGLTRVAAK